MRYAAVFVLRLSIGALVTGLVAVRAVRGATAAARATFRAREEFRAVRERCSHRYVEAIPYAWNSATWAPRAAPAELVLDPSLSDLIGYALLDAAFGTDPESRGVSQFELLERAKLAVTLEKAGHDDLAKVQWALAREAHAPIGSDITREFVLQLLEKECVGRPWEKMSL
jgi:hypothetical protein